MYGNQLRYAETIVRTYDGRGPLAAWLKQFFRDHKQMGSRDRKTLSEIVYSYYRLGHAKFESVEKRLLAAISIAANLDPLKKHFNIHTREAINAEEIFPWAQFLSEGIDAVAFANSLLVQPELFLRVRPGRRAEVLQKLRNAAIQFRDCAEDCIAVANGTRIDAVLKINYDVVIQDLSSQRTGELIVRGADQAQSATPAVWDCCAGSGGKSIMAYDLLQHIDLTATDIRESIIHNLHQRFRAAGINKYNAQVLDVAHSSSLPFGKFDIVIADVPCSGSGTWSRTPEQLFFATLNKVDYYSSLQKKVVSAAMKGLREGGTLVYVTCSVFKQENEEVVSYMNEEGLKTVYQKIYAGYNEGADTLFGAVLTNSST